MQRPVGPKHKVRIARRELRATGHFDPSADSIEIMPMHASKGLEFPVVALPGVGNMPETGESDADEAPLLYVAATRATDTLFTTLSGRGGYMDRFTA